MNNNNAQGVVPGYQPLRQNVPRSNTAGKHAAQQQLTGGQQQLPITAGGARQSGSLKYKKQQDGQEKHSQPFVQNSDPNISANQSKGKGLVDKGATNLVDRSDPILKKDVVTSGASPRPGAPGQIQIQSIIRNHYHGSSGTGPDNSQQIKAAFTNADGRQLNMGQKSKSTNQRPLRSSRQNNQQQSIVGVVHQSFDAPQAKGSTPNQPEPLINNMIKSLTQNQTPNISNFHPPAIQKHDNLGMQSSRRNARQQQISKNHPELIVNNSLDRQQIAYSYQKRGGAQQPNSSREQHGQQPSLGQGDKRENSAKFVRPNTASQTRKQNNGEAAATIGSPLIGSNRQVAGGLVPQPAAFMQNSATPGESILAQSSRQRRGQGGGAHKLPTPSSNQARNSNQVSLSQDQPGSYRRQPKEDSFFGGPGGDKKQGQTTTSSSGGLAQKNQMLIQPPGSAQQPLANTMGTFAPSGGHTERGSSQNRGGVQGLDMYGRSSGVTPGSSSHLNPLMNPGAAQGNHQRMGSQHSQSIPQYRKANLRDLRKSQRMQPQSKDKKMTVGHEGGDGSAAINPLTSVELNQNFQKRSSGQGSQKGILQTSSLNKNSQQLQAFENAANNFKNGGGHRNKETNRSLDPKRQLLLPSNGGLGGVGTHQLMSSSLQGSNSVTLQASNQNQPQASSNLVPAGYKRRNKRPGQSLNQLQLSHQGNLAQAFPDGTGSQKDQLGGSSSTARKRVELTQIGNSTQRGTTIDSSDNQNKRLQTDRSKHSRQTGQLVANSFDGGAQVLRAPSNHSQTRSGGPSSTSVDKNFNETPKDSNGKKQSQEISNSNERFNAITKFAFATSCGHQPGNPYKVNQDTYTLAPNMCGQQGFHLFVVCDGHGINGHKVSADVKTELPRELEQRLATDQDFVNNTTSREFCERIPRYFRDAFCDIHQRFETARNYDCHLSGTTVCAVLFDSLRIYCANAGDSRAVLYTQGKNGGLKVTPLSEDHKPSLPKEKARVEKMNGRVNPIIGPQGQHLGPDRVWMATEDTPGLAMSRSLGDGLAHSVGVSWEPEVKQLVLEPADKFIVIASDGVWEFLSNEQIARIVWPYYIKNSPEQAGNAIVRASAQKWKENDTVIDDITCITIFLEVD